MGSSVRKADAAVSMSENKAKSNCCDRVSAEAAIQRITSVEPYSPPKQITRHENDLLWALTRTVS